MTGLLSLWRQHTVTIEPHLGTGAYGDLWGPGVAVEGWLEETTKNVRSPDGSETVSTAQFHCHLDTNAPARSRGTFNGRTALVVSTSRMDGGTLPLPSHLVINFE